MAKRKVGRPRKGGARKGGARKSRKPGRSRKSGARKKKSKGRPRRKSRKSKGRSRKKKSKGRPRRKSRKSKGRKSKKKSKSRKSAGNSKKISFPNRQPKNEYVPDYVKKDFSITNIDSNKILVKGKKAKKATEAFGGKWKETLQGWVVERKYKPNIHQVLDENMTFMEMAKEGPMFKGQNGRRTIIHY